MSLTKIKGNTYFINAPTNIGIYTFKNKNCLLIDTGINNSDAKKIEQVLIKNNLHPKYIINTHGHPDHYGGNYYFKNNYPGCLFYTSSKEKILQENFQLFSSILSCSSPLKGLAQINKNINVDFILDYGTNKINDEKFEIISLKGHSIEQIGIITPEKVCFLGDAIFSEEIIKKYSLPYLYNLEDSIKTLNYIKDIDADYFVVSHGNKLYTKEEIVKLSNINIENIENYKNQILELLQQPLTKEDLLENICILNDISCENFRQYHLNFSGICAFITYLYNNNLINYSIEDGKLYYFVKEK